MEPLIKKLIENNSVNTMRITITEEKFASLSFSANKYSKPRTDKNTVIKNNIIFMTRNV